MTLDRWLAHARRWPLNYAVAVERLDPRTLRRYRRLDVLRIAVQQYTTAQHITELREMKRLVDEDVRLLRGDMIPTLGTPLYTRAWIAHYASNGSTK